MQDWDKLAAGSLAGHLIECGGQATGGLFTDWEQVAPGYANLGFPFVDVLADGQIELGKPEVNRRCGQKYLIVISIFFSGNRRHFECASSS